MYSVQAAIEIAKSEGVTVGKMVTVGDIRRVQVGRLTIENNRKTDGSKNWFICDETGARMLPHPVHGQFFRAYQGEAIVRAVREQA